MGSIIVGVAAIVVSAIFNCVALWSSHKNLLHAQAAADRSEERYRADRIEERKSRLLDALTDVSKRVLEWAQANGKYEVLLATYAERLENTNTSAIEREKSATALLEHRLGVAAAALADAYMSIQVATLRLADTGFSSEDEEAIAEHLQGMSALIAASEKAAKDAEIETPQQIAEAIREMKAPRDQVMDLAGNLFKLSTNVVAATSPARGGSTDSRSDYVVPDS